MPRFLQIVLPALIVFSLTACRTPPATDADVHGDVALRKIFSSPEDPRRYGLTVYESQYGPVFAGSKRLHGGQYASVSFVSGRANADPLIRVRGRGKKNLVAVVDSAARDSWATLSAFSALVGHPLGPTAYRRAAVHTAQAEVGYAAHVSKLIIDQLHIENMIVYLRVPQVTLGPLARANVRPRPDIVIGCDLLRQFSFVRIDYPARTIYFSVDRDYQGDPAALLKSQPYRIVNGALAVEAWIDGVVTNVILDTAGDFDLAWNKADGPVVQQFSMGDLVMRQVPVSNSEALELGFPEAPRVGHRILRRFAVVIDNKNRRILIERPSTYKGVQPEKSDQDGLFPKPKPFDWDEYVGQ